MIEEHGDAWRAYVENVGAHYAAPEDFESTRAGSTGTGAGVDREPPGGDGDAQRDPRESSQLLRRRALPSRHEAGWRCVLR